jgi:IS5 family transposase
MGAIISRVKGREGDRINAVLAAAGYNFSLLLRWLERLLRVLERWLACLGWGGEQHPHM